MAPKKGGLDSLKAAVGGLASRLPFPKRTEAAPEPFSAIEDDTPLGDLLSSENAAPAEVEKKEGRERPDFKALASTAIGRAVRSTPILIAIVVALVFILALVITGIIVSSPPKPLPAAAPLNQKGEALVRTWLLPPGDPLEPKMAMERGGQDKPVYTAEDAAKLGRNPDPRLSSSLRAKNDEAIDDLFGTVP
jgi:hypothetical protein